MEPTTAELIDSAHAEMFVALHEAVLEGFFERRRNTDERLTPLLSDVLTRMDDAYREVRTSHQDSACDV